VQLLPWEYMFVAFNAENFPDLFHPTWVVSLVFLVATVILYNVRTRQLRRHPPYLDMYEWMLWTGIVVFSLMLVYAVFAFDFIIVLTTQLVGLGALVWIRFRRFPPMLAAYEHRLARQRYVSRQQFVRPEATIRPKAKPGRRRRRR
jgi:hypothetical protein